jgi:hypothetical protein
MVFLAFVNLVMFALACQEGIFVWAGYHAILGGICWLFGYNDLKAGR